MKVAIIGTVGVPANYGGFETLVENIIRQNDSDDLEYAVFCSAKNYKKKRWVYKGARIIYLPLKANGMQSIIYDCVSICRAAMRADVLLILGVSGCVILPFIRIFCRKQIIVNIDGLEHRRDKWNKYIRKFLKYSEALAVKHADIIVSDNKGIQDYVEREYGQESILIEYGGDHVVCDVTKVEVAILEEYHLISSAYSLALCRIEPENNVEMILEAFSGTAEKLVFVGNWDRSDFGRTMSKKYSGYSNILLLSSIYDIQKLNVLRSNCKYYIHGHSAGGTNPSLVEAMYFGRPVFAFDVVYNKETTENKAYYFKTVQELQSLLNLRADEVVDNQKAMREIAVRRYTWKMIARKYEECYRGYQKSIYFTPIEEKSR